ncbi:LysR substrate-binding domain-containing protein [Pelagerythrobacter marensis]|uniref:LysR substrate-binding domain-containing protein n=1 Tax=Pelagerythrobacter marensis TaxID=543877 RepID=A0ABZ2D1M5_9SPHN
MLRKAPPLESVEIFVAAAQGNSLRAVGRRLALSPSAVSRRIAALEQFLGTQLFDRAAQSLALNAVGERYLEDVAPAIRSIQNATEAIRLGEARALRVATSHSLGGWLLSHLPAFQRETGVDVEIAVTRDVQTLASGEVHLAIWGDLAVPAGIAAVHLLTPETVPVCAPHLADGRAMPTAEAELPHYPLVSVRQPVGLWERWFAMAGLELETGKLNLRSFDTLQLAYEAAAAGSGITLAMPLISNSFLAGGRLVVCTRRAFPLGASYQLFRSVERPQHPAADIFTPWLREQIDRSAAEFRGMLQAA